jgi:alpha-tubulin suppressor-like RCC1 family protein
MSPPTEAAYSIRAERTLSALKTRFTFARSVGDDPPKTERVSALPQGAAESFHRVPEGLRPDFSESKERTSARVTLPNRANDPLRLSDETSGTSVEVTLLDARESVAEAAGGYVVYANGHASGATVLHRALRSGVEDYVSFDERPRQPSVAYRLSLGAGAAALRLVSDTFEVLDAGGAPRLRVAPPSVVGADGERTAARLSVEGCAVDTNPAAPWGRAVTPPGGTACTVRVSWTDHSVAYPALLDPRWETTGAMGVARHEHTATRLSDGRVLVTGGRSTTETAAGALLASAEIYDPTTRTWSSINGMPGPTAPRRLHSATLLTDGRVLVAGGIVPSGTTTVTTDTAFLYDAGTWSSTGAMNVPRHEHTATRLGNGRVALIGGMNGTDVRSSASIYNPSTNAWTMAGTMPTGRRAHTATLLVVPSNSTLHNRVLVVGGTSGTTTSPPLVMTYDGSSSFTTRTSFESGARQGHGATALADGKVLIVGGTNGSPLGSSWLFNPASATGSWTAAGTLSTAREGHTATLLPNGQVFVAGGSSNGSNIVTTAELWSSPSSWSATNVIGTPSRAHTATALSGNVVLLAGGLVPPPPGSPPGSPPVVTAASLLHDGAFGIACTSNAQCASGFCADGVCCNEACTGAGNACKACNVPGFAGTCSPKAVGTDCHDTTVCNGHETCNAAGTCAPGTPVVVDDGEPCTTDSCDAATGAVAHNALPNGTVCEEGNLCTVLDTCQGGECMDGPPNTCAPVNACRTAGVCNPATGACNIVPAPGNPACDDGNPCTSDEQCMGGMCMPGEATACTADEYFPPITEIDVAGGLATDAVDINNDGDVAGIDWGTWHTGYTSRAFRVDGTTGLTTLVSDEAPYASNSQAIGISPDGTLVGQTVYAFGYTKAGVLNTYPELWYSNIRGMNTAGQFTGYSYVSGYTEGPGAYRYTPATPPVIEFIGPVSTAFTGASANAIDDDGRVVGRLATKTFPPGMENIWGTNGRAFSWTGPNALQNLNDLLPVNSGWTLLGADDVTSGDPVAFDDGFVVGYGILNGELRGFRLRDDGTIDEAKLGPFVQSHDDTFLKSVNRYGDAVGHAAVAGNHAHRALLFTRDGETHDLNDFVSEASGWVLQVATAINDLGDVVGYGLRHGRPRGFKMALGNVLTPCPPPADACHDEGVRNAVTGACGYELKPNGATCEDGNLCTQADGCLEGACVAGALVDCVPRGPCDQAGTCDPTTGICAPPPDSDPECGEVQQLTCQGVGGACIGEEMVDLAASSYRSSLMDIIDVGPDDFVIGYAEITARAVRYRHYSTVQGQTLEPQRVAEGNERSVHWLRANTSKAVHKPDADCSDPTARWGTYTNFFAVQVGDNVYVDTFRYCEHQSFFTRTLIGPGTRPSIATTPDGTALIAYASKELWLTGRYMSEPPSRDGTRDAVLGAELSQIDYGRETDVIYNQTSDSFIIGYLSDSRAQLRGEVKNMRLRNGQTSPDQMRSVDYYDPTYGGHTNRVAYNPLGNGMYPWWHADARAFTIQDQNGAQTGHEPFETATTRSQPASNYFYNWVPIASTYDEDRLPLLYVFFKTNDIVHTSVTTPIQKATHLYGLRSDGVWTMVDQLGEYGVAGDPVAVRSLKRATVALNFQYYESPVPDYLSTLRLVISDHASAWPEPTPITFGLGRGFGHTCALRTAAEPARGGAVSCWGMNQFGQLGDGTSVDRPSPVVVPGLTGVTDVAGGAYHTCALSLGTVSCWGKNDLRQLGDGTVVDRPVPGAVTLPGAAREISVGSWHACAKMSASGVYGVYCWGDNANGQLGDGTQIERQQPVLVQNSDSLGSLSSGGIFTCAVNSDRTVFCWGSNAFGQLGDGTGLDRYAPVQVLGSGDVYSVVTGYFHACAHRTNGSVVCWGNNSHGQLGDGTTVRALAPVAVQGLDAYAAPLRELLTGSYVKSVVAGGSHTCALFSNGKVACWGSNYLGALGNGTTADSPTPTIVPGLEGVVVLEAHASTTCAARYDGSVACWGGDFDGGPLDNVHLTPVTIQF